MGTLETVTKAVKFLLWYKKPSIFFKDIFNLTPFKYQARVLDELSDLNIKRVMIMSASGTGKTILLAGIGAWSTTVLPKFINQSYRCIIISGSREQAKALYEYCRIAFMDNPILNELVEGEPLVTLTRFKDRSIIKALPNSLKAIQGQHADCVIVDEASLAGDFIVRDCLRIVVDSKLDRIILSGTPTDYDTLFVDMWEDTYTYSDWKRYHWSALDCPLISESKYREAMKLPEDMFSIFYEGVPYAKTGTLIPTSKLKKAIKDIDSYPITDNVIAGIDWGYKNPTTIVVISRSNNVYRVLYIEGWSRSEFEDIHDRIESICKEYNVKTIYTDAEDVGENQRLESRGLHVIPIPFNKEKTRMQSRLKLLFHKELIKIPNEYYELIRQLRKYNWDTSVDDDYVDALMLAVREEEESSIYWEVL